MTGEISCALSPIRIYMDLSRPDGRSILIGYVAELTTLEHRVMGLVAREALDADELSGLHGLLRHRASALWDFLAAEFELACAVEPGKGLESLVSRHSFALSFETAKPVKIPKSLVDAIPLGKEKLEHEFRSFLSKQAAPDLIQHDSGIKFKIAA